ncbi:sh3 domain containing protein [Niveomyces insectorum RCEF 264]|uniref:Sh3 domain containing protein n=1 Tax=Niveomyces insectorum RCEF 264 TaxID=1081102 RepID=A0A162KC54_9HYPO|nr:sh3 domain containing protein [Niveomyces insectorum RCEF 264]
MGAEVARNNVARENRRRRRQVLRGLSAADSASDEDGRLAVRRHHHSGSSSSSRRRSGGSPGHVPTAAAAAESATPSTTAADAERIVGHQSSLRSLISGAHEQPLFAPGSSAAADALDIEREIAEFAQQIQEEGLLDGLDLDNVDLVNDNELSQRIAEAYQRRQRGRTRPDGHSSRRRNASAVSHSDVPTVATTAAGTGAGTPTHDRSPRRPTLAVPGATAGSSVPPSSSRTSSRQRSQSHSSHRSTRSTGSVGGGSVVSGGNNALVPPAASSPAAASSNTTSSNHLEVRDVHAQQRHSHQHHHQRRRTASEGRSATTLPTNVSADDNTNTVARPNARSQTDLPLRPAKPTGGHRVSGAGEPPTPTSRPGPSAVVSTTSSASARAAIADPSPSSSSSSLGSAASPTATSFHARALAMGLPRSSPQQQPRQSLAELPASSDDDRARGPAAATVASAAPSQRPANNRTPPAVLALAANFAALPVAFDRYEETSPASASTASPILPPPPPPPTTLELACSRCGKANIAYDVHYNCAVCHHGDWNLCQACYRAGRGCLHWFGFGYAAWRRWEHQKQQQQQKIGAAGERRRDEQHAVASPAPAPPHMLTANRYVVPPASVADADPHDWLESGVFCAGCQAWANSCYWRCDVCNDGDWGFCNDCVNQGRCCTHPLLPLTHEPQAAETADNTPTGSSIPPPPPAIPFPTPPPRPRSSALLQVAHKPDSTTAASSSLSSSSSTATVTTPRIGSFRPLVFTTTCARCRQTIPPTRARFHCYACRGVDATRNEAAGLGDYDLCQACYTGGRLSDGMTMAVENGVAGWRRCFAGHRMVVTVFRADGDGGGGGGGSGGSGGSGGNGSATTGVLRRVVVQDLVGGWRLQTTASTSARPTGADGPAVETWYVGSAETRLHEWTVARDVRQSAQAVGSGRTATTAADSAAFPPPSGGLGRAAVARWAWYPEAGADDELPFPRKAEIREIEDVNGEWFYGVYMGRQGLFPGGYVTVI